LIDGLENERHDFACQDFGRKDDMPTETFGFIKVGVVASEELPFEGSTLLPDTSKPRLTKALNACTLISNAGSLDNIVKPLISNRVSASSSCSSASNQPRVNNCFGSLLSKDLGDKALNSSF